MPSPETDEVDERVTAALEQLPTLVDADADLVRRGRHFSEEIEIGVGSRAVALTIERGRVARVRRGPFLLQSRRFVLRAEPATWLALWQPVPAPGWHDLMALSKQARLGIEGDLQPFMANLQYIKDVLAKPRLLHGYSWTKQRSGTRQATQPRFEPIIGRYLHLALGGRPHRLYVEEAGPAGGGGIPLVCLHTAGADGRQFRHVLNDAGITDHYRVIVFDMPWHGKSLPPEGFESEEYQLTTDGYTRMVLDVCDALALERPVVMGCSIGGRLVLNLAAEHAHRFRALIGLESADYQQPWYDTEWLHRPDVNGGEVCAALVSGMMSPSSPAASRNETLWMYKSGGPGVFKGDLHFYRVDGDLRDRIHRIDTALCPLYMLTGEYDFSCTPADTERTAAHIAGAKVTVMKELGHFPMSENPEQFARYIRPVLDEIRSRA